VTSTDDRLWLSALAARALSLLALALVCWSFATDPDGA
jgi:hypothetical protein